MFTACGIMHQRCCQLVSLISFHLIKLTSRQYHRYIITTSCKHSLVLLRMGEIITRNIELFGITNKPLLLHLFDCSYYCISDARSYKNQIYITCLNSSQMLVFVILENLVFCESGSGLLFMFDFLA